MTVYIKIFKICFIFNIGCVFFNFKIILKDIIVWINEKCGKNVSKLGF